MIYSENLLLCIVTPLAVALVYLRGRARRFAISFLLGMCICLLSAYISGYVRLVTGASAVDTAVLFSPIVEEIMKFLPLLFYLVVFAPTGEDTMLFSVGIGVGFATFENCCYLLSVGTESLRFTMVRGLAVGVMHVVCMVILAYCVLIINHYHVPKHTGIVGALSVSVTFHALYNLLVSEPGMSSYLGYALPLLMAALVYLPLQSLVARVDL